MVKWYGIFSFFILIVLFAGCAGSSEGLVETVSALETQVAENEEMNNYQATQIGQNRVLIGQLSTMGPDGRPATSLLTRTPTPYASDTIGGTVLIHDGSCCVGGTAGETIQVDVQFDALSYVGEVVEMRVLTGNRAATEQAMAAVPWEPYTKEKEYPVTLATNWTTFWVHVQYHDDTGGVSEIFSDDIAVEGMPAQPTETPGG